MNADKSVEGAASTGGFGNTMDLPNLDSSNSGFRHANRDLDNQASKLVLPPALEVMRAHQRKNSVFSIGLGEKRDYTAMQAGCNSPAIKAARLDTAELSIKNESFDVQSSDQSVMSRRMNEIAGLKRSNSQQKLLRLLPKSKDMLRAPEILEDESSD